MMSITKRPIYENYKKPTMNETGSYIFFNYSMKKYFFEEMMRCLSLNIDDWIEKIRKKIKKNENISFFLSADESMFKNKSKFSPHRLFVKRKPNTHGLQFKTIADQYSYIFDFQLQKRTYEDVEDIIVARSKKNPFIRDQSKKIDSKSPWRWIIEFGKHIIEGDNINNHCIVSDSLYGGHHFSLININFNSIKLNLLH